MAVRDDATSMKSTLVSVFNPEVKSGGYPRECFEKKELKPSFECKICRLILKSPHQDDGGRYCLYCAECEGKDTNGDLDPDKAIEKQMLRDLVHCQCDRPGCGFQGDFRAFRLHYDTCEFNITTCPQCEKQVKRHLLEEHQANECANQEIVCPFCNECMRKSKLDEHHKRECISDKCIFGCDLSAPTNMREHHEQKHVDHLFMLRDRVEALQSNSSNSVDELALLDKDYVDLLYRSLRDKVQARRVGSASEKGPSASGGGAVVRYQPDAKADTAAGVNIDRLDELTRLLTEEDEQELGQLMQAIGKLEESCSYVKTYIAETYKQVVVTDQGNAKNAAELETLRTELDKLKFQFAMQVDASKRLDSEVRHLETTTHDGLFVFRIPEWNKHVNSAKISENYSIYSTSFYTHQGGYRMRMRVFPLGEKGARNKFLSVYINIMKGPYDPILPWPFRRCIVLTCLDQRDMKVMTQQEHSSAMTQYQQSGSKGPAPAPIIDPRKDASYRLRPDPNRGDHKRAFGLPTSTENPSIGFLRFVALEALREPASGAARSGAENEPVYCRNDTVFLRCAVEPIEP